MPILEVNQGSNDLQRYLLLPGEIYTIGRKECRLPLPNGDPSISRHHATITVDGVELKSLFDPSLEIDIFVQDFSKHGTLVNEELIGRTNGRFIYTDDSIKFGKRVLARVFSSVLVFAESSELTELERITFRHLAFQLGALIVQEPVPSPELFFEMNRRCLGFLYITHDKYKLTPGVLLAMAHNYHITTLDYLKTLLVEIQKERKWKPKELPLPKIAEPINNDFSTHMYMRPKISFYDLNEFLTLTPQPKKLLRQFTFIVPDVRIKLKYEAILYLCGATVVFISLDNTSMFHAYMPEMTTVVVTSDEMFNNLKRILGKSKQNLPQKQEKESKNNISSTNLEEEKLQEAFKTLYKNGVCLIPEQNIKRAIFTGNSSEINGKPFTPYLLRVDNTSIEGIRVGNLSKNSNNIKNIKNNDDDDDDEGGEICETVPSTKVANLRVQSLPMQNISSNGVNSIIIERREIREEMREIPLINLSRINQCEPERDLMSCSTREQYQVDNRNQPNNNNNKQILMKTTQRTTLNDSKNGELNKILLKEYKEEMNLEASSRIDLNRLNIADGETRTLKPPVKKTNITNISESTSLEKKPIIVYAPIQLNATEYTGKEPIRRRVVAHKLLTQSSIPISSTNLAPLPSSSYYSNIPIYESSSEEKVETRLDVLQGHKKRRQQREAFESGAEISRYNNNLVEDNEKKELFNHKKEFHSDLKSSSRRPSTGAYRYSDSNNFNIINNNNININIIKRSGSAREPNYTLRRESIGRSPSYQNTNTQQQQLATRTTTATSIKSYHTLRERNASPIHHFSSNGNHFNSINSVGSLNSKYPKTIKTKMSENLQECNILTQRANSINSQNHHHTAVEFAQQQDLHLKKRCEEFLQQFLNSFVKEAEKSTRFILKQSYLDTISKKFLEDGVRRVLEFLNFMQRTELEISPTYSSHNTREISNEVRRKCLNIFQRMKATYEAVNAEIPVSLQKKLRESINSRSSSVKSSYSTSDNWKYTTRVR